MQTHCFGSKKVSQNENWYIFCLKISSSERNKYSRNREKLLQIPDLMSRVCKTFECSLEQYQTKFQLKYCHEYLGIFLQCAVQSVD